MHSKTTPSDFKWRYFQGEIILWAVRWYCKYGVSFRDLEEMLCERGVDVDHTTIYRWVQHYAPEIEKRLRWYWQRPSFSRSWRVDETYVKVKGRWAYLYRAVDKTGSTIDFYLSPTRNAKAAKRFLEKAMKCLKETIHRKVKYLNNIVEADHGKLKRLIKPTLGFKSMKTS